MAAQIQTEHFVSALNYLFEETFDNVVGIYLDKGTSLFETLAGISADEASVPVGGRCGTLAAQVKHTAYYLDVLEQVLRNQETGELDWDAIWRETRTVTPAEWEAIKTSLRAAYGRVKTVVNATTDWTDDRHMAAAMSTIVHTAYHLGEIRQALCILKA